MPIQTHANSWDGFIQYHSLKHEVIKARTWEMCEITLKSENEYENPYLEPLLKVTFTGPDNQTIEGYGFWDGDNTFKIRAMFPVPGTWHWQTECSDATDNGLHQQSGKIKVRPYGGNNPLYKHGYLKTSPNNRFLQHADGTPFLWIGDTPWLAYVRASREEWERYIAHRRAHNFSVVMMSCAVTGLPSDRTDREGCAPFLGDGYSKWNPAFWKGMDEKVQYANKQGIVVVITGLIKGRMRKATEDELLAFARNMAARYAGNFVIFSPEQDWGSGREEMRHRVGEELKKTASRLLVTQHPKRRPMPELVLENYYHPSYIDFVSVQTGIGPDPDSAPIDVDKSTKATVEWITALYREEPHKPVINLEGVYDQDYMELSGQYETMARRGGYLSFLSGAFGFTTSTFGIWAWGKPVRFGKGLEPVSVMEAMNSPYVKNLKLLAEFFKGIEWWKLEPDHGRIKNQSQEWKNKMVLAASPEKDLLAAFLPGNPEITVDVAGLDKIANEPVWFNPLTGEYRHTGEKKQKSSSVTYRRPEGWKEAVLLLMK